MVECSFKNLVVLGSSPVAVASPTDFTPASSKEFLDIQATIAFGFTVKRIRGMTRTNGPEVSFEELKYICAFISLFVETLQGKGCNLFIASLTPG